MEKAVQHLRELTVIRLRQIWLFHCVVMMFFLMLKLVLPSYRAILPVGFVSFCNALCLAERCWTIQRRTMEFWPLFTQIAFLATRFIIISAVVVVMIVLMGEVYSIEL